MRFRNLSNYLAWHRRIFLSPGLEDMARRTIASFDIVHLHDYRSYQNITVAPVAKTESVPLVIQAHGSLPTDVGNVIAKKAYDAVLGEKVLRCVTGAVALNQREAQLYEKVGIPADKVRVIPNAVDPNMVVPRERRIALRRSLNIPLDARVVTYLGRLHQSKGIEVLVEAIALVAREGIACFLVLAGADDGMETHLRKLARRRGIGTSVKFAGYLDEETRLAAIATSDVLAIPTFTGFPMTILEAYSLRVPVITTMAADNLDWLTEDVASIVPFDAKCLAHAAIRLLLNPTTRNNLAASGQQIVVNRFNWDVVGKMYEGFYEECTRMTSRTS